MVEKVVYKVEYTYKYELSSVRHTVALDGEWCSPVLALCQVLRDFEIVVEESSLEIRLLNVNIIKISK